MIGSVGTLPGGHFDAAGRLHREFELTKLTGRDEELLTQSREETASLVSAVLARSVARLGDISPVTEDVARQLLVADRRYLLLKLRQMTFGDFVGAEVFCPWPDCGRRMSLRFKLADVPIEEPPHRASTHTLVLSPEASGEDFEGHSVGFRLPNGADQEELAPLLTRDEARALTRLLGRTVQRINGTPAGVEHVEKLSPLARAEIEAEMERLAPKVELNMDTSCPECGRGFAIPFDLHRLFFGDLRTDSALLYRQVHYLAFHYHWSEREIMAMTRDKRLRYVELLADEIDRLNNGG